LCLGGGTFPTRRPPHMTQRDKRALLIFCGAVIVALALWLKPPAGSQPVTAAPSSVATLEKRLRRLQERASQKPLVAAEAEAATRALAETERGLLRGATPALASAEMQQLIKQMLQTHGINMQASEFGPVKTAGEDYSQVPLSVSFPCAIEQWI